MPSFMYTGLIILVMGGGFVWYYNTTQAKIETITAYNATLTANVDRLEEVNSKNVETIAKMEANFEKQREQYNELQAKFGDIRSQNNKLRTRLGRHDLGALGVARPDSVQRVLNNASKKVNRCFEILSGGPLTDTERSAKNGKAFNSECPWIYDDLVASGVLIDSSSPASENSN